MHRQKILFALFFVLPFLLGPFIYSERFSDPVHLPRLLFFSFISVLGLIDAVISHKISLKWKHPIILSWASFFVISLFACVSSPTTMDGLFMTAQSFIFLTLLILICTHWKSNPEFHQKVVLVIITFTFFLASLGTFQAIQSFLETGFTHQSSYEIKLTFAHRNLFSQLILLSFPFSIYGIYFFRKNQRILAVVTALLAVIIMLVSMVRSVWLGLAISLVFLAVFSLFFSKPIPGPTPKKGALMVTGLIVIIFVAIGFLSMNSGGNSPLIKQGNSFVQLQHGSQKDRALKWDKSLLLFKDRPFLGQGAGSWRVKYASKNLEGFRPEIRQGELYYQRPHNDFLWVLSENGLAGFLAYFLVFLFTAIQFFRLLKESKNSSRTLFILTLAMSFISYVTVLFFSFPKERPMHSFFLALILGALVAEGKNTRKIKANPSHRLLPISLLIIALLSCGFFLVRAKNELVAQQIIVQHEASNENGVLHLKEKIDTDILPLSATGTPIHWYSGSAHFRKGNYPEALDHFRKSYKDNPNHLHVLNNLGSTFQILGQRDSALLYYNKALTISTCFKESRLNKAAVLYNGAKFALAHQTISACVIGREHPNYDNYVLAICSSLLQEFIDSTARDPIVLILERMKLDKIWLMDLHLKAVRNDLGFINQAILDAFYTLETLDKLHSLEENQNLRTKYSRFHLESYDE